MKVQHTVDDALTFYKRMCNPLYMPYSWNNILEDIIHCAPTKISLT